MACDPRATLLLAALPLAAQVLTSQYDNARTNATLHETILTPANVTLFFRLQR